MDFRDHISTFQAKNTRKSKPFKVKNNAETTSEQLQINFQKVKKTTFLAAKMVKLKVQFSQKFRFLCVFWAQHLKYCLKIAQTDFKIVLPLCQTPCNTTNLKLQGN